MSQTEPLLMRFDGFELDEANARLTRRAEVLEVPPRAFSVLCELARRPGHLVTKDALLDAVWGHRHVTDSVLKSAISQLRAALDDDSKKPRFIETASRRGYRFVAAVEPGSGPTSASRADAVPAAGAPTFMGTPAPNPMTGRRVALARLHTAWERARAGQRQMRWLAGEAGVGKTTLVDNFVADLGAVGFAHGQCVEQRGPGEPYLPVLEALSALARDDSAVTTLLRTVAPTWLLQLPWLCSEAEREGLRRELAGTTQDRMLREFGELLDRYTRDKPLLLVTEDLHWSDHATVNLMNHVARRRGAARWMWLATFRIAEVFAEDHPVKSLRHELRLHHLAEEIIVDPFSEVELSEYVARRLDGAECPDAFLQALHRHTDGLPLFVANVVDDLLVQGALQGGTLAQDALANFQTQAVPENLAGVMERQILRLPADQTALLEAASACGVEFKPTVVADVMGRDADWVARQCDVLARHRQWLASSTVERAINGELEARYAFRHALVRRVFHDRVSNLERARLHRSVALSLAKAAASGVAVSPAEVATQFELGQDPDAALPYFAAAAAAALQQFAPADALRLTDRGLALVVHCRSDTEVHEVAATLHTLRGASAAQVLGVSADETLRSFERAHAAMEGRSQHPLRSMALHGLGLAQLVRSELRQGRELAERSLAQARQREDAVMTVTACDLLGQFLKLDGPPKEAIAVLEQGIEAAATLSEQTLQTAFVLDPLVNMRAALAIPLLLDGCDQRSRTQSDLALARAQALKQPMAQMVATWLTILCEIRRGDRGQVAAMAAQLRTITDEGALASSEGPSEWLAGLVQAWSGMPVEGHTRIDRAHRHSFGMGMQHGASEVLGYATEALVLAGDWRRAAQAVEDALQLAARLQDFSYRTQLLLLKRRIALADGAKQDADDDGRQALLEARRQLSPWLELTVLVDVCDGRDAGHEDIEALRSVVANLREASSAPLVGRARALLDTRQAR